VSVQTFRPELSVKALDKGVIRWLAEPREVEDDILLIGPQIQIARDELRSLVDADRPRIAHLATDPFKRLNDIFASKLEPFEIALNDESAKEMVLSLLGIHGRLMPLRALIAQYGFISRAIPEDTGFTVGLDDEMRTASDLRQFALREFEARQTHGETQLSVINQLLNGNGAISAELIESSNLGRLEARLFTSSLSVFSVLQITASVGTSQPFIACRACSVIFQPKSKSKKKYHLLLDEV